MATTRITAPYSSPYVTFYMDADVVETQTTGGNGFGRWRIRFYLRMSKASGSFFNNSGVQIARVNGSDVGTVSRAQFLPSSLTSWNEGPYDRWVNANSNGYWSGSSTSLPISMGLAYGNISADLKTTITLPRINVAKEPAQPRNPSISALTTNSVKLSWTAPPPPVGSPVSKYRINWSLESQWVGPGRKTIQLGNVLSYTIVGLLPGTTYLWNVQAGNSSLVEWGPYTPTQSFTTLFGTDVKVGSAWNDATPYVKQPDGTWRAASFPEWKDPAGVWKPSK